MRRVLIPCARVMLCSQCAQITIGEISMCRLNRTEPNRTETKHETEQHEAKQPDSRSIKQIGATAPSTIHRLKNCPIRLDVPIRRLLPNIVGMYHKSHGTPSWKLRITETNLPLCLVCLHRNYLSCPLNRTEPKHETWNGTAQSCHKSIDRLIKEEHRGYNKQYRSIHPYDKQTTTSIVLDFNCQN